MFLQILQKLLYLICQVNWFRDPKITFRDPIMSQQGIDNVSVGKNEN